MKEDPTYSGVVLQMAHNGGHWERFIETSSPEWNIKLAKELIERLVAISALGDLELEE